MAVPVIYFLDDDENIIKLVKYGLRNEQFNVKYFSRPTALIEAIKVEYPDVVISDVMMPDMDGITLIHALRSRRTLAVSLLSFSSGLPLGLVWYAIPDWMRDVGVDIRVVGLITLAQAPWSFKVIWSPLMDRYVPPFWGRRRGWMAVTQLVLLVLGLMLAGVGGRPEALWVVGALAFAIAVASASQDIAIDAWRIDQATVGVSTSAERTELGGRGRKRPRQLLAAVPGDD